MAALLAVVACSGSKGMNAAGVTRSTNATTTTRRTPPTSEPKTTITAPAGSTTVTLSDGAGDTIGIALTAYTVDRIDRYGHLAVSVGLLLIGGTGVISDVQMNNVTIVTADGRQHSDSVKDPLVVNCPVFESHIKAYSSMVPVSGCVSIAISDGVEPKQILLAPLAGSRVTAVWYLNGGFGLPL